MKKRFVPILMVLVLVISLIPTTVVHANDIRVTIDGQLVNFPDQHSVIVDGRTLVPVRGVFEALGFDVDWWWKGLMVNTGERLYMMAHRVGHFAHMR